MVAAASPRDSLEEVRARLERIYSQHGAGPSAASSNGTNGSGSSSGSGAHAALVRSPPGEETVAEALRIQRLLGSNTEELRSVVRALNGEYVLPEAGGDLLRDGAGEGGGAGWGGGGGGGGGGSVVCVLACAHFGKGEDCYRGLAGGRVPGSSWLWL